MSMTMNEIERALRELRMSGILATLSTRILQSQANQEPFLDTFSMILQDELDGGGPAWRGGGTTKPGWANAPH